MCPTLHFIHEDRLVYVSLGKNIIFALLSLVFFFFFGCQVLYVISLVKLSKSQPQNGDKGSRR